MFQKFLFFVLKSSDVLDILIPILFNLNNARADQCKITCNAVRHFLLGQFYKPHAAVYLQLAWASCTSVCSSSCC